MTSQLYATAQGENDDEKDDLLEEELEKLLSVVVEEIK